MEIGPNFPHDVVIRDSGDRVRQPDTIPARSQVIQIKPTIIYTILSALLFGGLLRGRALLKTVLEHGYDGLSDRGWLLLSRNWAWFFAAMAIVNELLRRSVGFDAWLTIKVWGVTILTILFAAANVPMLLKHGLGSEEKDSAQ